MIAIKLTEFDLELNVFVILRLEIILALGILASSLTVGSGLEYMSMSSPAVSIQIICQLYRLLYKKNKVWGEL